MTHRSYSNQSVLSLALASRGLVPTRIVHEAETFEPRTSFFESMTGWFVVVTAALFRKSLPTG